MKHYARFYRCALQVNPYCYSVYRGDAAQEEDSYNAAILQKCKENNIQVVGLANHGDVDSSESLRSLLAENGIIVFPGFEIMSAEKIHMVCLFPENKTLSELNRYLGALGLRNRITGNETSTCTFEEIAQKVVDFGGFFYAAHITSDNGVLKIGKMQHIWKSPLLIAAQIPDSRENVAPNFANIINNTDPQYKRERLPAYINASDVEKPDDLDRFQSSTLIKMSEPTFDCFVMAFRDPELRIRLLSETDSSYQSSINAIHVFGGYLDGLSIEFSSHLDTIIGGRGTGKSTIINLIRYALNREPQGSQRKEFDKMIEHNLGSGSKVEIKVASYSQHGRAFTIIRRFGSDPVVEDENGQVISLKVADLLPNIEIYGQNEIVDAVSSDKAIPAIINRLLVVDHSIMDRIDQAYRRLQENTEAIIACNKQISDDEQSVSDLPSLMERLRYYQEAGLEERLPILMKAATEEAAFSHVKTELEHLPPIQWKKLTIASGDIDELTSLRNLICEFNRRIDQLQAEYDSLVLWLTTEYHVIQANWEKQNALRDQEIRESLTRISGIQDKTGREIAQDFSELIKRTSMSTPIQQRIECLYKQKERLLTERKTLIEACRKGWDLYVESISKQIKRLNKTVFRDILRISVRFKQNRTPIISMLKEVKGIGDVSLTGLAQYPDFDVFSFADDIRCGKETISDKYHLASGIAEKITSAIDEERLLEMEGLKLEDIFQIELLVNGQYRPIERLSKGQQCTALLHILLVENKDPLIIDQPEDNLDNAFIAESLIVSIRKNKLFRQYVFATHNANIPVFGDAELIVAMEEREGNGYVVKDGIGSIDTSSVRECVIRILEGGREAFIMREEKYGIGGKRTN